MWAPTGETYTYAELHRAGERLAAGLAARLGLSAGDRIAVLAENTVEHMLLFCAAQKAGHVLVPLNYRLAEPELQYLVSDSEPHVLFASGDYLDTACGLNAGSVVSLGAVARIISSTEAGRHVSVASSRQDDSPAGIATVDREEPELDDPLMILYISGTAGRPKGTIIPHKMLFWNSVNTELRLNLTAEDRSFNAAPFRHTGGWNVLLTPLLHHGATTCLFPSFDAGDILRTCEEEALTILWGVPTMLKMMADHAAFDEGTLDTVRSAVVGGKAMPKPLIRTWQDKGVPIRQGFGMTEAGVNCFSLPESDALRKIGSIGFPNFYVDTRVVDEDGDDVGPNTTGELLMRGSVVTPGYWRNSEATDAAIDDDSWFHTSDLVTVDEEGYYYVVGRKHDMFISGGENVYPTEIESALHEHPAVDDAAVIGVPDDPDDEWGEVGAAFVVPDGDLTPEAVSEHCRTHLAGYKVPKHVRMLDELPLGDSGKVDKAALRAQFDVVETT